MNKRPLLTIIYISSFLEFKPRSRGLARPPLLDNKSLYKINEMKCYKMKWLERITTGRKERYLLSMIGELKLTIEDLRNDKLMLIKIIESKPKQNITHITQQNKNLTRKEKRIYDTWNKNKSISKSDLSKKLNLKQTSLKVYCSRLSKKQHKISFKEDEF